MDTKSIKQIMEPALREAGEILANKFEDFDRGEADLKSKYELVTKYDLLSEKVLVKKINENFPEMSILSEEKESKEADSEYQWVLDPLDGTTNFTIHNPFWCISASLFKNKQPIVAIIYAPTTREMFTAVKGGGAFLNDKKIKVSDVREGKVINAYCHGKDKDSIKRAVKYYEKQKLNQLDARQMGSAALELSYVAAGRLESMTIPGALAWDVGAGVLLVREAGGTVTDFAGDQWNIESHDMLASNTLIHDNLLKTVKNI